KKTIEDFLGNPIDISVIQNAKAAGGCNDDYDCVDKVLRDYGKIVNREDIIQTFDTYYETLKYQERWLIDKAILQSIKKLFVLGIVTGRPKCDTVFTLEHFQMQDMFDIVITRDVVREGKPDPEGILMVFDRMQTNDAVYIGDNPDDALAAQRAGCPFI